MGIVVAAVLIALAAAGIYVYSAFASAKKGAGKKQDASADTEGVDALASQPSPHQLRGMHLSLMLSTDCSEKSESSVLR